MRLELFIATSSHPEVRPKGSRCDIQAVGPVGAAGERQHLRRLVVRPSGLPFTMYPSSSSTAIASISLLPLKSPNRLTKVALTQVSPYASGARQPA